MVFMVKIVGDMFGDLLEFAVFSLTKIGERLVVFGKKLSMAGMSNVLARLILKDKNFSTLPIN